MKAFTFNHGKIENGIAIKTETFHTGDQLHKTPVAEVGVKNLPVVMTNDQLSIWQYSHSFRIHDVMVAEMNATTVLVQIDESYENYALISGLPSNLKGDNNSSGGYGDFPGTKILDGFAHSLTAIPRNAWVTAWFNTEQNPKYYLYFDGEFVYCLTPHQRLLLEIEENRQQLSELAELSNLQFLLDSLLSL